MSLSDCISRWPSTTRWPWLLYALLPRYGSSTDACASFAWRNSGSSPSRPSISTIQARVPTLPTPTTLRARSTYRKRSSSLRRSPAATAGTSGSAAGRPRAFGACPRRRARRSARSAEGRSMIRGSPSTSWVSFANALRLSFVRAFSTFLSMRCDGLGRSASTATLLDQGLDVEAGVPEVEVAHRARSPAIASPVGLRRPRG